MNLFIFIFRDYISCLPEAGAVPIEDRVLEEKAIMLPAGMVLQLSHQMINSNTLDMLICVISFFANYITFFILDILH